MLKELLGINGLTRFRMHFPVCKRSRSPCDAANNSRRTRRGSHGINLFAFRNQAQQNVNKLRFVFKRNKTQTNSSRGSHAVFLLLTLYTINLLMPSGAFNICCPRDCVSRHNGCTSGAPLKPLRVDSALKALSTLRGLRGAPVVPPLCRETQSLGQQMLKEPLGINGLGSNNQASRVSLFISHPALICNLYTDQAYTHPRDYRFSVLPSINLNTLKRTPVNLSNMLPRGSREALNWARIMPRDVSPLGLPMGTIEFPPRDNITQY